LRQKSRIQITFEIAVRVLLMTAVFTLLGFAIGLFCGIGATMLFGVLRHTHPDMTMAYKFVAAPFAAIALVVTFFVMLFTEIRRVRRPLEYSRHSTLPRTS
jgi:uncharacterized BrkB/YihY/UPF0761 family membrane protein